MTPLRLSSVALLVGAVTFGRPALAAPDSSPSSEGSLTSPSVPGPSEQRGSLAEDSVGPAETSSAAMETIVVTGRRRGAESFAARSASALDVVDLEQERAVATDMGTVLRRTRGIILRQAGGLGSRTSFSLNGLSGRQIPIFVDGLPIELSGFATNIAAVPVGLVRRLDVHKGVVPIELGADALGGAIDLRTREVFGTRGFASYERSSFGTHRILADLAFASDDAALYGTGQVWYDEARNDYAITVDGSDPDTGRIIEDGLTVEKNNAEFQSFGVSAEIGARDLLGTGEGSLRAFYGDSRKGLPHDLTQDVAFGEVETGQASVGGVARYRHTSAGDWLDLDLSVGLVRRDSRLTDLAETRYDFEGNPVAPGRGELVSGGIEQNLAEWRAVGRLNFSAPLGEAQTLALTLAPELETRGGLRRAPGGDGFSEQELSEDRILSFVGGLAHRFTPLLLPFENDLFVKLYVFEASGEEVVLGFETGPFARSTLDVGVGDALVWNPSDEISVRASAEWATRLPDFFELFGDGVLVSANGDLVPERSLNINLAASATDLQTPVGRFAATVWGFGRITEDLILIESGSGRSRYVNVDSALVYGVEGELGWTSPGDYVRVAGALTYEEGRNTSLEGPLERFRDDRLPNRPYLYGSASMVGGVNDLSGGDRLEARASLRWVHEFFRLWPSAGREDTKAVIPEQIVVDVGVLYRVPVPFERRANLALSLESHNVLDARVFDELGAQRPGRSFHFKVSGSFQD